MKELSTGSDLLIQSLNNFGQQALEIIPSIIGIVFVFLIGWIIAKIVSIVITKVLTLAKFDVLADKVNVTEFLQKAKIEKSPSKIVGTCVYYVLLLLVIITACDTMGLTVVSEQVSVLIGYLPKLFVAILLFVLGAYLAGLIRDIIAGATSSLGIGTGKIISNSIYYLLMIMVLLTSLNQAGIDTTIITSNVLLILAAILASASISYGIASRDVLRNILAGFFSKGVYTKGMKIQVDGITGVVLEISNIGIYLKEESGDITIIPTSVLINNKVRILSE